MGGEVRGPRDRPGRTPRVPRAAQVEPAGRAGQPDQEDRVDQVGAVRDWLRRQGVDPGPEPEPGADLGGGGAAAAGAGAASRAARTTPALFSDGAERDGGRGRRRAKTGASSANAGGGGLEELEADPEEVARRIVLGKLAVQARTRVELERALQGKDVPDEAAARVLDRMSEVGLVDDATFAKDWVSSRQQRRHLSRTALRRELQTKGVERDLIDEALSDVETADEHRAALDLARRRFPPMAGLPRETAYRRLGGMLARRGFSGSVAGAVLAEVLGDRIDD